MKRERERERERGGGREGDSSFLGLSEVAMIHAAGHRGVVLPPHRPDVNVVPEIISPRNP